MKKILHALLILTLAFTACKKDDEQEPIKKEEPTLTEEKFATCKLTSIDDKEKPTDVLGGVVGFQILESFAKRTWKADRTDISYFKIDDSTWNHFIKDSPFGANYDIEHYNEFDQLTYSENYQGNVLMSKTEYEYTSGLKTETGREYYLPKSIITTAIDPSAENSGYIYRYTGSNLDSILYANTNQTYIRYEKKSELIRKATVINNYVPGGIYYEEHLNEYGRVTKIDVFLAHGPKNIGYGVYEYDCK